MNLLTIACERDKDQLLLLAESIDLFVNACTHYIVINEENTNIDSWKKLLQPYYNNNCLKILYYPTTSYIPKWKNGKKHIGWHRQQVLKFLAFNDIQDDYLILDSKNIFVQSTDIKIFKNQVGSGLFFNIKEIDKKRKKTYNHYKKVLQNNPKYICQNETPFVFRKKVLQKLGNVYDFAQWFSDQDCMPMEFVLYSFLISDQLQKNIEHHSVHYIFWKHQYDFTIHKEALKRPIHVLGFHRLYLQKVSHDIKDEINLFLKELGFKNQFAPAGAAPPLNCTGFSSSHSGE